MIDYQNLFNDTSSPFLILDPNLNIVEVNKAYLNATMRTREDLMDQYLFDAFPENPEDVDGNGVSNLQKSLEDVLKYRKPMTMAVQKYDIPIQHSEGGGFQERFWCSVNSPVINSRNEVIWIIHNAKDVTEFIQNKQFDNNSTKNNESMQAHMDHLKGEIYRSAQELQEKNKQLQIANDAKLYFLTSMSHELRTPLNAILGFAQILEMEEDPPLNEEQLESVSHILKSGEHLLSLINDVLDLSKVETGKTELYIEELPLKFVIDECISLMQTMMIEYPGIRFQNQTSLTGNEVIYADSTRTKQILFNLLSNAIKYNRDDGVVILKAEKTQDNMMRISVADTGQGIPEEKNQDIFEPFKRLGKETTTIEGTGIGLSISKRMVEHMRGRIDFKSQIGEGSTFWFDLPMTEKYFDSASVFSDRELIASGNLPTIKGSLLYVEDNRANVALMEMIVSKIKELKLITAPDAEIGIAMARQQKPDIIILDIHLPGISGYDALKTLNNLEETAHIPKLALSAAASQRDIDLGLEAGFVEYLTKPINIIKLSDAIDRSLKSGSA